MAARRAHATGSRRRRRAASASSCAASPGRRPTAIRSAHLRIAHLTDQHVGRITPFEVQLAAVEMTNAEKPDLVLLTGDFVCHSQLYLDQLTEVMRAFQAPVIAVLGNHDHWSGADEVKRALERGGVEVLCNRHTTITLRHERLQVVGLDDAYTGHARRDEAVKGLRQRPPEHRPVAHRRGGRRPLAPRRAAGAVGAHARRPGDAGAAARARGRHASPATTTCTASTDRAATRTTAPTTSPQGAVYVGAGIGAAVVPFRFGDRGKREVTMFELGCEPGDFVEHHAEQEPLPGRKPTQRTIAKRAAAVVRKRLRRERGSTLTVDRLTPPGARAAPACSVNRAMAMLTAWRPSTSTRCPICPYDYGALEPHISGKIMQLHHDKHHAPT